MVVTAASVGDVLVHASLFAALPPTERSAVISRLRHRRYAPGSVLFHQGDPADSLYLVESGHLKVVVTAPTGDEAVLALFGPGSCFGELALLDGRPRSASVIALERAEIWQLSQSDFRELIRSSPEVAEGIFFILTERIRHLSEQVEHAFFHNLRSRLAEKLLQLGTEVGSWHDEALYICLPLTQGDLASMIGASRQQVNRLISEWRSQGVLSWDQGCLTIYKPDQLHVWDLL